MKREIKITIGMALAVLAQAAGANPLSSNGATQQAPLIAVQAMTDDMLESERGGEAVVVSNQTLVAVSEGSSIIGDYSAGTVSLSDNALSNFNGIGNLVINTGAQNNLQSGMNVTINVMN